MSTFDRKPLSNRSYILQEIRAARAHANAWVNTIDAVGVALEQNLISAETAVGYLRDCGFFQPIVDAPVIPETPGDGQ